MNARITALLEAGELERTVGFLIDGDCSRVLIGGNPKMVDETRERSAGRGLTISRRGAPGLLAVENYR